MPQDLSGIFKPEAKTIKQVFSDTDSYYQIPDYQRPYRSQRLAKAEEV